MSFSGSNVSMYHGKRQSQTPVKPYRTMLQLHGSYWPRKTHYRKTGDISCEIFFEFSHLLNHLIFFNLTSWFNRTITSQSVLSDAAFQMFLNNQFVNQLLLFSSTLALEEIRFQLNKILIILID